MKKLFHLTLLSVAAIILSRSASAQIAPAGTVFISSGSQHYIFASFGSYQRGSTFIYLDLAAGLTDAITTTISPSGVISGTSGVTGRSVSGQVSANTISLIYKGNTVSGSKLSSYGPTRKFAGIWDGFVADSVAGIGYTRAIITSQGQIFVIAALGLEFDEGIGTINASGHFSAALTTGASISGTFSPENGIALGTYSLSTGRTNSYGVARAIPARLDNISTRGLVASGQQVLIGGFIVGDGGKTVLVDAKGPSLAAAGVSNPVRATKIDLYHGDTLISSNIGWRNNANADEIEASGVAPTDDREAALQVALEPGTYTVIVSSADSSTGIGLMEIYGVGGTEGP